SDCRSRDELVDPAGDHSAAVIDDGAATAPVYGPKDHLAFVHRDAGAEVLMAREQGMLRELVEIADARISGLAFSSDAMWLAYSVDAAEAPGIYAIRSAGGSGPNRLTEERGDVGPVFIGDEIVFSRPDAHG